MVSLTLNQAATSLYGVYRLARLDPGGMAYLDASLEGFWRSFWAAAIVAPFYGVLLAVRQEADMAEAETLRYWAVEGIAYAIGWLLYPVVMLSIANLLEREERYLGYIVAYNWATVLQYAIFLSVAFLHAAGFLSADMATALMLILFLPILVYVGFIAKTALGIPVGTAAGLVVLDFVLGLIIDAVSDGMLPT